MRGPAIAFDHVGLELSGNRILEDVTFSIAAGTIHCIIGPNGGGKTSLIRSLLGQMPHRGRIEIAWADNRTVGYVPQSLDFDKTLPITVGNLMAMITQKVRPAFLGLGRKERVAAAAALERVGLKGKLKARLGSLSGGERQRVLFAQALLPEPGLLVLDEPMTSLDEVGSDIFVTIIRGLAAAGTTVVWIAHDLSQVRALADSVTCINRRVLFTGPPAEVLTGKHAEILFGQVQDAK